MSGFVYDGNAEMKTYTTEEAIAKLEEINGYKFSEQQLDILNSENGIKIVALAGGGKTSSIVNLVTKRIMTGEIKDASKLLMTTYSKAGAENMTSQINSLLQKAGLKDVHVEVRTLHSLYFSVLNKFSALKSIVSGPQRLAIIRKAVKNCKVSLEEEEIASLDSLFSYQLNNMLTNEAIYKSYVFDLDIKLEEYTVLLKEFNKLKQDENVMDFDDLQLMMYYYLCTNNKWQPMIDYLHNSYDYIYVDEFQDTSAIQYKILQAMIKDSRNVVFIGDDDQCLVEGTEIKTIDGIKKIEDIVVGDKILTGVGHGEVQYKEIDIVSKKLVSEDIVYIRTKTGKTLNGTNNHIVFTKLPPLENIYEVYLMYRHDIGFRIGQVVGQRSDGNGSVTQGIAQRLNVEKGDRVWILKLCQNREDASYWESYYSYKYSIPQYVFKLERHINHRFTEESLRKLHKELDTYNNGLKLLVDLGMDFDYPHFIPKVRNDKCSLNYTMFMEKDVSKKGIHFSELSMTTVNNDYAKMVNDFLNLSKKNKRDTRQSYWSCRSSSLNIDLHHKKIKTIERIAKESGVQLVVKRKIKLTTGQSFNFMPMGNVIPGMKIAIYENDKIIEDEIVEVMRKHYNGYVYDISVPETRNFVANSIFTHNCIYSWRGARADLLLNVDVDYHVDKLNLDTNYRCRDTILQFAKSGVEHMSRREPKDMKALKDGGSVNFVYKDSNDLYEMSQYVADKIESMVRVEGVNPKDICVLVRYNAHAHVLNQMLMMKDIYCDFGDDMKLTYQTIFKDIMNIVELCGDDNSASYDRNACSAVVWKMVKYLSGKNSALLAEFMQNTGCSFADSISWILANVYSIGTYTGYAQVNAQVKAKISSSFKKLGSESIYSLKKINELLTKANKDDRLLGFLWLYKEGMSFLTKKKNKQRNFNCYYKFFETLARERGFDGFKNAMTQIKLYEISAGQLGNTVKLSTIHGAKGLEWKHVFILAYDNISFPDVDYMVSKEDISTVDMQAYIDGERRLAYVAMTRAIDSLTIVTDAKNMSLFGLEALGGFNSRMFNGSYLDFAKFVKSRGYMTPANMHLPEEYEHYIVVKNKNEISEENDS